MAYNFWKGLRDERSARCDELCNAVTEVAELAAEFWSTSFAGKAEEQKKLEGKILSIQWIVEGYYSDFREILNLPTAKGIDSILSDFTDCLSGGNFDEIDRPVDQVRMYRSQTVGGNLILTIRRAHRETFPLYWLARIIHENRQRELDMPTCIPDT